MGLTRKDVVTTVLVVLAIIVTMGIYSGIQVPVFDGVRMSTALLGMLGIAMCASGARPESMNRSSIWTINASVMGIAAATFLVLGIITAEKMWALLLGMTIVSLWVLTTINHLSFK